MLKLKASLASAEVSAGAVAKADQYKTKLQKTVAFLKLLRCLHTLSSDQC